MPECPGCGASNPDGATFCGLCARPFVGLPPGLPVPVKAESQGASWSALDIKRPDRRQARRHRYISAGVPIAVVLIAVAAVVLVLLTRTNKAEGSTEFRSASSGLSFKYPESWQKQDKSFLTSMSKKQDLSSLGNEVILLKRGEVIFQHLLTVTSSNIDYGSRSWSDIREGLKSGFESTSTEGSNSTFSELTLPPETGAKGIVETYYVDEKPELFEIEGTIIRGNTSYDFNFATPLRGKATDETDARTQFFKIINSLAFQ